MVMPYHLHMPSYFLETFTEYPSKKDLPNILVYIELILTVFLPSFRMKDYMTNYRNFDIPKLPVISYFLSSTYKCNFLGADNKQ